MDFKQKIIGVLRWSQKYTQTDMVYLAVGGFWLTLWQFFYSLSTLLLSIVFANLLAKETYGSYCYIISIAGILAAPTLFGMNTAVVRAIAKGYEGSLLPALKARLRWGVLGSAASLAIAGYYYFISNNITLAVCFLVVATFISMMDSFTVYQGFWNGKKLFGIQVKYNIIIQVLTVAAIITTLLLTKNLFLIILSYFASYTFFRFVFLQITLRKISPGSKADPGAISYGKHLSLMGAVGIIADYLDRIIIWHQLGAVSVAVYFFAVSLPQEIEGILKNIGSLALPKFSKYAKEELKSILPSKVLRLVLSTACLAAIYILLAPFLYRILFPRYLDSVLYSQVFSFSLVLIAGTQLLSVSLTAQGKKRELYIARSVPSAIEIILFLILIPLFGIWGAIAATLVTEFIRLGLYLSLIVKL